jgi:alpha-L-rhamnosidase
VATIAARHCLFPLACSALLLALVLLLQVAPGHVADVPPQAPFALRTEYLGAPPSAVTGPPPPPASDEGCTAADGSTVGGVASEWLETGGSNPAEPMELFCKSGVITRVEAFFGTPFGSCAAGFHKSPACDAPSAQAVVDALCLQKKKCAVPTAGTDLHWKGSGHPSPLAALFLPDPCMGKHKYLAVKATCGAAGALHARSALAPAPVPPPPSPALGIDAAKPRFSWQLNSTRRGDSQAAYELRVVEQFNESEVVWTSGKVASPSHTLVEYAGAAALAPLGAYSWSVRWWSSASGGGGPSDFSAPQRVDMAPAAASWDQFAEWVGGGNQLRADFTLGGGAPVSATLCVAGLGLAKPFINGQRVGDHAMGPQSQLFTRVMYTSFDVMPHVKAGANALGMMVGSGKYGYLGAWCQADSAMECLAFRLLLHVRYGDGTEEIIGSEATGWKAREGPVRSDDYYYGEFYVSIVPCAPAPPTAVRSRLGTRKNLVAALSRFHHESDTSLNLPQDARREHTGWASPGFNRTLGWAPAVAMAPNVSGTMSSAVIQPIRPSEKYEAISIKVQNKPSDSGQFPLYGHPEGMGIAIYDFGQNLAGYCIMKLPRCTKGNLIRLRYAETTWPDANGETRIYNQFQSCSSAGSQCAFQEDTYICSGKGNEIYEPTSTYHGFRYVEVTGWGGSFVGGGDAELSGDARGNASPSLSLTSYLVHTNVAEISATRFDSFNHTERNIINDIKHITLYAQKSNFHSIPTDCPTRERRGWMGDAWVSSDGGMLTLDTAALHTKWIRDIFDEQARSVAAGQGGCAPNIAPAECPGGTDEHGDCNAACGAPPWAIAAVVLPYNIWRYHGDTRLLAQYYPNMKMFMEWLQSTADKGTGLVFNDGLADWCPPANVDNDPKQVSSFSQVMGYQMLAEAAEALGKHDEAAAVRANLTKLRVEYTKTYYNSSSGQYEDSAPHGGFSTANVQTSNSMALYLGIPTAAEQAKVVGALVQDVERRGHHLSTGIVGTRVLLQSLPTETAYTLAIQETYPGPGNFVRNGATTMWERWEATTHDPTGGSSMNHIMYGGMQSWYFNTLLGVTQAQGVSGAGYQSFRVAPKIPMGLAGAALQLQTDGGEIRVQWSQGNATHSVGGALQRFALSVTVPVGARAELCLPTFGQAASAAHVTEGGTDAWVGGKFAGGMAGCIAGSANTVSDGLEICFACGCGSYELSLLA